MSKIPVEKKRSGMPWWAWLLIAVVVIALIWMLWPLLFGAEAGALLAPALAALLVPPAPRTDALELDTELKEVADDS